MKPTQREATYVYSFPQSNREKSLEKMLSKTITPGPGQYNPNKVSLSKFPQISIGNSKRAENVNNRNFPSVGKYNLKTSIGEAEKITMSSKFYPQNKSKINRNVPGPGSYNANYEVIKNR